MKKLLILGTLCLLFAISVVGQSQKEWEKVQSLNSWNVYQQFILNYPNGKYTEDAKKKQSLLEKPAEVIKVENKVSTELPADNSINSALGDPSKNTSPIVIKKRRYYVNDKMLNNKDLKSLLSNDPASADEYKKAKNNMITGLVPMYAGTGLILYGTIVMLKSSEDEANANIYGGTIDQSKYKIPIFVGCGLVVVGLPFIFSSVKHLKISINNYNSKRTTGYNNYQKLELGITQNGLRMTYRF